MIQHLTLGFGVRRYQQLSMLVVTVAAAGCLSPRLQLTPISNSNRQLVYQGFSATAPTGDGWSIATPATPPFTTQIVKKGPSRTNTLAAMIAVGFLPKMPPDRLFNMLSEAREAEFNAGRFGKGSFKGAAKRYRNADCLRYDTESEDLGVPRYEGSVFILDVHGLTCLHPDNPSAYIDITYSQRRLAAEEPVDITAEGESFIASLEFIPFIRPFVSNGIEVRGFPQMVAIGHGSLWVTRMSDNVVDRIDTELSRVLATIEVGHGPVGLAVTDTAVWVANRNSNMVSRIDPNTNMVVATIKVGLGPWLMQNGFGSVWVTNSGGKSISRIDPQTNTEIAKVLVGNSPSGIGATEDAVWVTNFRDKTVQRIDPESNQTQGNPITVGAGPNFLVGDGTSVWVVSQNSSTLYRINSETNAIESSMKIGSGLGSLVLGHGFIWVTDFDQGNLLRADPQFGKEVGPPIHVGPRPLGVAATPEAIFVVLNGSDMLLRVEP